MKRPISDNYAAPTTNFVTVMVANDLENKASDPKGLGKNTEDSLSDDFLDAFESPFDQPLDFSAVDPSG